MRLTVDRHDFAAVLAQAVKYVEARTPIAVLSTLLLRAGDGEVEVVATDRDCLFRATVKARVEAGGAIAANGGLLAGFVRGAAGEQVDMTLAGSLLEVRSGHARGRIPTLAAADFPEPFGSRVADVGFELDGAVLANCLDTVSYAVSTEEARYYLRGINWSIQGSRLELCGTNGHVLSVIGIDLPVGAEGLKPVIVPDIAMPAFTGPVRVDVADTFIRFSGDAGHRVSVTSKLVDGTFPDYKRIIQPAVATATMTRKALADAVGRCMPLYAASRKPIDLIHDTKGELVVRINGDDGAEIEDRIEIEGSQFVVSLSPSLLGDTLAAFDAETIEIGLTGLGDNVRFSEPGQDSRLSIVMPMRGVLPHRIGPPPASEVAGRQAAE